MGIVTSYASRPQGLIEALFGTALGKKVLMALTGLAMLGFVFGHLTGNLLAFQGPQAINAYAAFLRQHPMVLWIARLTMLGAVGIHGWAALTLFTTAQSNRPVAYRMQIQERSTFAAKLMRFGGIVILAYVVIHLFHLTFGTLHGDFRHLPGGVPDAYHNVVAGFQNPVAGLIYIVAMGCLAMHLYHGVWSLLQTLGLAKLRHEANIRLVAAAIGVIVFVGYSSLPVSVWLGILKLGGGA